MYVLKLGRIYGTPVFTLQCSSTLVQTVYGANYSGKDRTWRFPAFRPVHSIVISDLRKAIPALQLTPEVEAHLKEMDQPVALPDAFTFTTTPYQHQLDGLIHAYGNLRSALFYAPGLGKCKITVDLQRLTQSRMLILCPVIMLATWASEFGKHGGVTDVLVLDGTKQEKLARMAQAQKITPVATIVTYSTAALYVEDILRIGYDTIIADESHALKTPFSKRTVAAIQLATRAHRRLLLSGTPSLGSPFDLYAQLRFLGTYFCPENWWKFRKTFGVFHPSEAQEAVPKMLLGFTNMDVMNTRVGLISLRKTKEECLDLPAQVVIDEFFTVYSETKQRYNTLVREGCLGAGVAIEDALTAGLLTVDQGSVIEPHVIAHEIIAKLNKVDQLASGFVYLTTKNPGLCNKCTHVLTCTAEEIKPYTSRCKIAQKDIPSVVSRAKTNARLDHCRGLLEMIMEDPTNKVIIWARYIPELDDIETAVQAAGFGCVRVQGGQSRDAVHNAMTAFNTEPNCRVYLAQVATGVGVTLNAANYMIFYNLPWSLDHYLQALDRNYRIGQERKVTVYRLIGNNTLDIAKREAIEQKVDFSQLVTSKAVCITCTDYYRRCRKYKIELYDDECKYDRTMFRKTATLGIIP